MSRAVALSSLTSRIPSAPLLLFFCYVLPPPSAAPHLLPHPSPESVTFSVVFLTPRSHVYGFFPASRPVPSL